MKTSEQKLITNHAYYLRNREKIRERSRKRYEENKEDYRIKGNIRRRKSLYKLSDGDYKKLLEDSKGICAICRNKLDIPTVDHDHETGKIRGILCRTCNKAIGLLKDDISVIENAAEYLKATGTTKRSLNIYYG